MIAALEERGVRPRARRLEAADRILPPWVAITVITLFVVVILGPVVYMLLLSLTSNASVALGVISFAHMAVSNYVDMWSVAPMAAGLVHSLVIAGSAAGISAALGLLSAYPLARCEFRGRRVYLFCLIGAQTVPATTLLLPLFASMSWLQSTISVHVIGSYPLIIITYMTFGLPLSTWLLVMYLRTVPLDLEEAAQVDGASRLVALVRVVFPLVLPALVVCFLLAFLVGWNDVLFASEFTNNSTQTLAIVLERFSDTQSGQSLPLYGDVMASTVVSAAPVVALYLVFQRRLVHGLSAGALTGV